ncbi:DNA polymerase IV [Micrococcus lacusdianchii]|uniref:DNA polymerase IV n=2 Tax=Micrococcus TaxID=1269 RepID=UPI00200350B6|nr:DNA polymerase IV [Micrococcus sp. JXJ CY 30]
MSASTPPSGPSEQARAAASILHVDMDAFFLSVELRERPELIGAPAAVAAPHGRSVVLSASYAARAYGVRSAMPLAHARALCPPLVVVPPRQQLYREVSAEVMALFDRVTAVREQLSVDEAFLDVAGARRRLGPPERIGRLVRERVRAELGLPCTVGAAGVKFVAKMASTAAKPEGLLVVPPERTLEFLHPRPVDHLWGVGPQAARRLRDRGVATIGDLAAVDPTRLRGWFGAAGEQWHALAWGRDPRPVAPRADAKTIGADHTFDVDATDPADVDREVLRLSLHVAARLRATGVEARAVTVRVKDPAQRVRSRTGRLPRPSAAGHVLHEHAGPLVAALLRERPHPVRLVGVRAERLGAPGEGGEGQEALFESPGGGQGGPNPAAEVGWSRAEEAADAVARRFPGLDLRPATLLERRPRTGPEGPR